MEAMVGDDRKCGVPILDRPEERPQWDSGVVPLIFDTVPILDRPEERPQFDRFGVTEFQRITFQSSIAPKSDRNCGFQFLFCLARQVPILDRPEERPQ